jgi:hypothetical protein
MPYERRTIVFLENEVIEALDKFRSALKDVLPAMPIDSVRPVTTPEGISVEAVVRDEVSGDKMPVLVPPEHLAAALMLACRRHKIPLPRWGTKGLKQVGQLIALQIELEDLTKLPAQRRAS